jgi:hypothetical protein
MKTRFLRLPRGQRHEQQVGGVDGHHHRPQPARQPVARDDPAAQQAADRERSHADGAVDDAHLGRRQRQPAAVQRVQQEGRDQLDQLGLAEPEQQQEGQHPGDVGPLEEGHECRCKPVPQALAQRRRPVGGRSWQLPVVPQRQQHEQQCQHAEHRLPGCHHLPGGLGQAPGGIHQPALAADHRHAVEQAAHTHEGGLLVLRQRQQVEAVGGDVVRGRGKGQQPEHGQAELEDAGQRQCQRHRTQRRTDDELQGHDPPALGAQQVHQRRPQRLDDPRQVQPARVERDRGVVQAQVLVQHHRQRHHHHIGQALAVVQGGDPPPGGAGLWQGRHGVAGDPHHRQRLPPVAARQCLGQHARQPWGICPGARAGRASRCIRFPVNQGLAAARRPGMQPAMNGASADNRCADATAQPLTGVSP